MKIHSKLPAIINFPMTGKRISFPTNTYVCKTCVHHLTLHKYLQYYPPKLMNFDGAEDPASEDDDDEEEDEEEQTENEHGNNTQQQEIAPVATQQNLVVASTPWNPVYQIVSTNPVYNVLQPFQAATSPLLYLAGANHLQIQPQNVQLQHQNLQQQQQHQQGMQLPIQDIQGVQLQPQGVIITPVYNLSGHTSTQVMYLPNNPIQPGIPLYEEDNGKEKDADVREKDNLIESLGDVGLHGHSKFLENESESDMLCDQDTNDIFKLLDSTDNLDVCFEDLQSSLKLFMEDKESDVKVGGGGGVEKGAEVMAEKLEPQPDDERTQNVRDIIEIIPLGQDYHPANVIELIPGVHLKELAAGGNIFESAKSNSTNFVIPYTTYGELTIGSTTITRIPQDGEQTLNLKENDKPQQRLIANQKAKETPAEKRVRIKKMHAREPPEKRKERLRHLANLARKRRSMETEEEKRFRLDRNSRQKKEKRRQNKSQYVFHVQLLPNGKYVTTCIPKNNQKN